MRPELTDKNKQNLHDLWSMLSEKNSISQSAKTAILKQCQGLSTEKLERYTGEVLKIVDLSNTDEELLARVQEKIEGMAANRKNIDLSEYPLLIIDEGEYNCDIGSYENHNSLPIVSQITYYFRMLVLSLEE